MATYTTTQGDVWDWIAYTQLGSESYAPKLMANNYQYRDVQVFSAGVVLELPEITDEERNNNQANLSPWRVWE